MLDKIKDLLHITLKRSELSVYDKIDNLFETLDDDIIVVKIGTDLSDYKDVLLNTTEVIRKEIKEECGFIMPAVVIKGNLSMQENEFCICIRGIEKETRFVVPVEDEVREEFYDSLKSVIYGNLNTIFTNEITEKYINTVQKRNNRLVWNITSVLSVIDIKTILSDIILKGKSISNINYIFEKIGEHILSDCDYTEHPKHHNPHNIAKQIAKSL